MLARAFSSVNSSVNSTGKVKKWFLVYRGRRGQIECSHERQQRHARRLRVVLEVLEQALHERRELSSLLHLRIEQETQDGGS